MWYSNRFFLKDAIKKKKDATKFLFYQINTKNKSNLCKVINR